MSCYHRNDCQRCDNEFIELEDENEALRAALTEARKKIELLEKQIKLLKEKRTTP